MERIIVGTTSRHKILAVRRACREAGIVAEVFGMHAESGEDAQPFGYDATYAGANARATQARGADPAAALAIGIESGIRHENGDWIDFAVIVAIPLFAEPVVTETEPFGFPEEYVAAARGLGFATTTVGDVLHGRFGCDGTDPHSFLSEGKVSRSDLLVPAIVDALKRAMKD